MKLKYKILWIEDELDSIERPKNQIQRYLEDDYGFECSEDDIVIKDYDEFEEEYIYEENQRKRVKDSIKEFDLLLIDFNLGEEEQTGDKLIDIIRDGIYSEILFYSSELESINKKLNNHFIDGVFTSDRDHLEDKIKKLINVTIKKVQDVNNLRGLIMAEVAELDRIKKNIIQKFNKEADSEFKKYIKEDVFSKIKKDLESLSCLVKVEDSECSHDEINLEELQNNFFYDSFKKSRTVNKIKSKKCNHIDFKHEDYRKDVIAKRNVLAHQKEDEDMSGKFLLYPNGDRLEFTEEHCVKIRKDIKKYKKYLEDIEKVLTSDE
ncbi:hypothetical protein ACOTWR_08745 [Aliarcobacter butzleri]|uniref:hypothetical protein n=1 Tax=Aliarcobacter butzleri TaxID=28197 RepID=UPI0027389E50|nr:hypothetical protein [Aliarcobacter butzleri]